MKLNQQEKFMINHHDALLLYLHRDDDKVKDIIKELNNKYGIYCKINDSFCILTYTFYITEPKFYGIFYKKHVIGEIEYFKESNLSTDLKFLVNLDDELKRKMSHYTNVLIKRIKEIRNKESLERIKAKQNNAEKINKVYKQQKGN